MTGAREPGLSANSIPVPARTLQPGDVTQEGLVVRRVTPEVGGRLHISFEADDTLWRVHRDSILRLRTSNVFLGLLRHEQAPRCGTDPVAVARVEVTYQRYDGGPEFAGYFRVVVPSIDPEGLSEHDALELHPATLAVQTVEAWADKQRELNKGYVYFSVDDVHSD